MVARFSSEFVEARRRALERFLRRIASHAEFIESEIVVAFLENDPASLHKLKENRIAARSKSSSSSKMSWFESTITQAINGGKAEVEKSAADEKVEEINQYLTQLEKQMSSTIKHSEHLVKRSRDISQAMFELGQSMTYLGQNEGDGLGTGLTQVIKRN
jgi:sorting nexin-1/2